MVLDIKLLREEATADLVRESQRRRFSDPAIVDQIIELDKKWRETQYITELTKKMINNCSKAVSEKKKAKEADKEVSKIPADIVDEMKKGQLSAQRLGGLCIRQLIELSKMLSTHVSNLSKDADELMANRDKIFSEVGNVVHESVPVSQDEDTGNLVIYTWGDVTCRKKLNHVSVMERLGLMDTSKAVTAMSGGRAFVLRGGLVQLQVALISYSLNFLIQRGYEAFYPPFFLNKNITSEVAQLSDFDDALYKVSGDGDEKYLIATSEMSIAAYHRDKWFTELKKPLKYAGISSCFRKEAGAHGRDTLGIFRVHQFEKIEQFIVCTPHDNVSWQMLEDLIQNSKDFNESLGLPYRVVVICSGALNNAAAKKYDLEGWFPGSGAFRELVSCSNCTDYQARSVNCRCGPNLRGTAVNATKEFCHMLNGTLCAVTRVMCAICENFQTDEGVVIPEVLRPYMMGIEMLKFPQEASAAE